MKKLAAVKIPLKENIYAVLYAEGKGNKKLQFDSEEKEESIILCYKDLKEVISEAKRIFEFEKDDAYNLLPLHINETQKYFCGIFKFKNGEYSNADNEKINEYYPTIKNSDNNFLKLYNNPIGISFQFINYLGKSKITFGESDKFIQFEVVPQKIDYKEDYIRLTEDIAKRCSSILLNFSSPTYLNFKHDSVKQKETVLEQFIFLREFCYADNLFFLFSSIKNNPDRMLVEEDEFKQYGTAKPSKKVYTNPFAKTRNWNYIEGYFFPQEISSTRKYDSFNTPANRFIKYALNIFMSVANEVANQESGTLAKEATNLVNSINDILYDSFFDDVEDLQYMPENSQVLEKKEGYSQIFNALNMIELALQLDWKGKEDVYKGENRNTALLYEYWLFFVLYDVLKKNIGSPVLINRKSEEINEFITYDNENKLLLTLKEGKESRVSFCSKDKNLKIDLFYNRTFKSSKFVSTKYQNSYSRDFRPDYTISIYPNFFENESDALNAGEVVFVHFDAKYRLTDLTSWISNSNTNDENNIEFENEKAEENVNTYKRGDLLKMHTYNDAIRRTVGSYVLYPGNSLKAKTFNLYDEILPGVGAFAVSPSNIENGEKILADFIKKIIAFQTEMLSREKRISSYKELILHVDKSRIETKSNKVLVGFLRSSLQNRNEYYDFLEKNKFFIDSEKHFYFYYYAIKDGYVYPMHQDIQKAKKFRFYKYNPNEEKKVTLEPYEAEIIGTRLVNKTDLISRLKSSGFVSPHEHNAQFYYLVELKNMKKTDKKIIEDIYAQGNDSISRHSPKVFEF